MFAPEHRQAAKEKEDFVHEGGVGSEFKPHYLEEADGTIKQGDTVGFDLAKATLTSKANL